MPPHASMFRTVILQHGERGLQHNADLSNDLVRRVQGLCSSWYQRSTIQIGREERRRSLDGSDSRYDQILAPGVTWRPRGSAATRQRERTGHSECGFLTHSIGAGSRKRLHFCQSLLIEKFNRQEIPVTDCAIR